MLGPSLLTLLLQTAPTPAPTEVPTESKVETRPSPAPTPAPLKPCREQMLEALQASQEFVVEPTLDILPIIRIPTQAKLTTAQILVHAAQRAQRQENAYFLVQQALTNCSGKGEPSEKVAPEKGKKGK